MVRVISNKIAEGNSNNIEISIFALLLVLSLESYVTIYASIVSDNQYSCNNKFKYLQKICSNKLKMITSEIV